MGVGGWRGVGRPHSVLVTLRQAPGEWIYATPAQGSHEGRPYGGLGKGDGLGGGECFGGMDSCLRRNDDREGREWGKVAGMIRRGRTGAPREWVMGVRGGLARWTLRQGGLGRTESPHRGGFLNVRRTPPSGSGGGMGTMLPGDRGSAEGLKLFVAVGLM